MCWSGAEFSKKEVGHERHIFILATSAGENEETSHTQNDFNHWKRFFNQFGQYQQIKYGSGLIRCYKLLNWPGIPLMIVESKLFPFDPFFILIGLLLFSSVCLSCLYQVLISMVWQKRITIHLIRLRWIENADVRFTFHIGVWENVETEMRDYILILRSYCRYETCISWASQSSLTLMLL